MKKTLTINLGGSVFHIDEDAFLELEKYLGTLKSQFRNLEGGQEIVQDVEARMAELFAERLGDKSESVTLQTLREVIGILGQPEDYLDSEEYEASATETKFENRSWRKKIFRDGQGRILGGVSAGLAAYFGIDVVWVRLLFLILLFTGPGILLYLILWIIIPIAKSRADRLQMQGKPVNLDNLQESLKTETAAAREGLARFGRSNQGFLNDFGRLLGDLLRFLFKFLFKLLGLILLLLGISLISTFIFAWFTGDWLIEIEDGGQANIQSLLQLFSLDGGNFQGLMVGVAMLVLAPLILMIYGGLRILFRITQINPSLRNSLLIITLVGLLLTAYSGTRFAREFSSEARVAEQKSLQQTEFYHIEAPKLPEQGHFFHFEDDVTIRLDDTIAISNVRFSVLPSSSENTYLQMKTEARGLDLAEARRYARAIKYPWRQRGDSLLLPDFFKIEPGEAYRFQQIEITLYLAVGDSIFLSPSTEDILYDIPNVNGLWDYEMLGHRWRMTSDGLLCADCQSSAPDKPRESDKQKPERPETESKGEDEDVNSQERFGRPV